MRTIVDSHHRRRCKEQQRQEGRRNDANVPPRSFVYPFIAAGVACFFRPLPDHHDAAMHQVQSAAILLQPPSQQDDHLVEETSSEQVHRRPHADHHAPTATAYNNVLPRSTSSPRRSMFGRLLPLISGGRSRRVFSSSSSFSPSPRGGPSSVAPSDHHPSSSAGGNDAGGSGRGALSVMAPPSSPLVGLLLGRISSIMGVGETSSSISSILPLSPPVVDDNDDDQESEDVSSSKEEDDTDVLTSLTSNNINPFQSSTRSLTVVERHGRQDEEREEAAPVGGVMLCGLSYMQRTTRNIEPSSLNQRVTPGSVGPGAPVRREGGDSSVIQDARLPPPLTRPRRSCRMNACCALSAKRRSMSAAAVLSLLADDRIATTRVSCSFASTADRNATTTTGDNDKKDALLEKGDGDCEEVVGNEESGIIPPHICELDKSMKWERRLPPSQMMSEIHSTSATRPGVSPGEEEVIDGAKASMSEIAGTMCTHYTNKTCSRFHLSCCDTVDNCHRCHAERTGCEAVRPPKISSICCDACGMRQSPSAACQNPHCPAATSTKTVAEHGGDDKPFFSRSYCGKCMVWSNMDITHCDKCGVCRMGKPEDLYHCDTCDACFLVSQRHRHRCLKSSLRDQNCPFCLESVYYSQSRSDILRCGHVVHYNCLRGYLEYQRRSLSQHRRSFSSSAAGGGKIPCCPTCRKCLLSPEDITPHWRAIRQAIHDNPMPASYYPMSIRVSDKVKCNNSSSTTGTTGIMSNDPVLQTAATGNAHHTFLVQDIKVEVGDMFATEDIPSPAASTAHQEISSAFFFDNSISVTVCYGTILETGATASFALEDLLRENTRVSITCTDCELRSLSNLHPYGLECGHCGSFNTCRL